MKELKDMSEVEIKAICYDQLAQIEQCQVNLKVFNQELVNRKKPAIEKVEVIKEKPTK